IGNVSLEFPEQGKDKWSVQNVYNIDLSYKNMGRYFTERPTNCLPRGKRFKSGHGRARMQEHFYRRRQKRRFSGLYKSEYTIKVQWSDTDAAGIAFFGNYYQWMEEAFHHFFDTLGFNASDLYYREKIAFPLVEAHCRYHSPLYFGDKVTIYSAVAEASNRAFKLTHDFYKDNELVASGYTWRVWTDFSESRPKAVSIPEFFKKALSSS